MECGARFRVLHDIAKEMWASRIDSLHKSTNDDQHRVRTAEEAEIRAFFSITADDFSPFRRQILM
jgi:hypothetical protein